MADIYFHPIATTTIYFPTPGIDVPEYECFAAPRSVGIRALLRVRFIHRRIWCSTSRSR